MNAIKYRLLRVTLCLTIIILLPAALAPAAAQEAQHISRLGEYSGYSSPVYTEWVRTSQYVTVRDGTRLAVDVIRPAVDGKPVEEKLPVIYVHERYQRARVVGGELWTLPALRKVWPVWSSYGYVIAVADVRGGGASFGTRPGELLDVDAADAYDVIAWLAAQPWCDGNVGMVGISYNAITQFSAASAAPPALKVIVPHMGIFDLYAFVYPGGIYRYEFLRAWSMTTTLVDKLLPPIPVDDDPGGAIARMAVAEHLRNVNVYETTQTVPYRDAVWEGMGNRPYIDWSLSRFVTQINRSGVAVYQGAGWYDMWPRAQAAWFNNLTGPQRIVFTPFSHGMGLVSGWRQTIAPLVNDDFGEAAVLAFHTMEHLRIYDYYLKGIDNGLEEDPPVWYYLMGAPAGQAWRPAETWPLPNEVRTRFYFQGGPSGSIASVNDGTLGAEKPGEAAGFDPYLVDYTTSSGNSTRWHNGHGGAFFYGDMTEQGRKSLTYTTDPLPAAVEITGHPVVRLWVTATSDDADFFVYLEEVDANGYAHYLTEGALRASHRALAAPPYNYMGLPWHRSYAEDVKPLPRDEPVELVFDLLPISNVFDAGHRIRVRITGADADNYLTPALDPAPTVTIYRDAERASHIELPIIPAASD